MWFIHFIWLVKLVREGNWFYADENSWSMFISITCCDWMPPHQQPWEKQILPDYRLILPLSLLPSVSASVVMSRPNLPSSPTLPPAAPGPGLFLLTKNFTQQMWQLWSMFNYVYVTVAVVNALWISPKLLLVHLFSFHSILQQHKIR